MSQTQHLHPRKRPTSDHSSSAPNKRARHTYSSEDQYPPAFWDDLSTIHLTKRALRELDRRNALIAPKAPPSSSPPSLGGRPPVPTLHRPIPRGVLPELNDCTATDFLDRCGKESVKAIKQLARSGGPDLTTLRGFPQPIIPLSYLMSSTPSASRGRKRVLASTEQGPSTTPTTTTKSFGPYDRNFLQKLIDAGVYPYGYMYPDGTDAVMPDNWEDIKHHLKVPRRSLSPSKFTEEDYRRFVRKEANAAKEKQVETSVIPIIDGNIADDKCVSGGIPLTNLAPLTNGVLKPGNPDIYHGARPEQLDRRVRDEISDQVVPTTQDDLPIVPNFFLAAKGPDGIPSVGGRQVAYDGALGARGMHSLRSYCQGESAFDNKAYTITSIYQSGHLKMYTSHPAQPGGTGTRPEYYLHQLRDFSMTDDSDAFRQGATAYRNARDWAKEQRDNAIDRANKTVRDSQVAALAIEVHVEQEYSLADKLSATPSLSEQSPSLVDISSTTKTTTSPDEPVQSAPGEQQCQSPRKRRKDG